MSGETLCTCSAVAVQQADAHNDPQPWPQPLQCCGGCGAVPLLCLQLPFPGCPGDCPAPAWAIAWAGFSFCWSCSFLYPGTYGCLALFWYNCIYSGRWIRAFLCFGNVLEPKATLNTSHRVTSILPGSLNMPSMALWQLEEFFSGCTEHYCNTDNLISTLIWIWPMNLLWNSF